jgi:D-alanyl-D-alanine carboxypeptidase
LPQVSYFCNHHTIPMTENRRLLLILISFVHAISAFSDTGQRYIFFLHNKFIEVAGLNGIHDEYGHCEYRQIVDGFTSGGFTVISEVRAINTDALQYAGKVVKQVDSLLRIGVDASDITIIGTSKGGFIAQYVSGIMKNPRLNFVFIGSCSSDGNAQSPGVNFCGNILSVYERSDEYGQSCEVSRKASTLDVPHYKELSLNTGFRHGYLYKASPEWMRPAMLWASKNYILQDTASPGIEQKLNALIDKDRAQAFNGIIMISKDGSTIYTHCKGFSDLDKKTALRFDDQFIIGSISKQITAVLVLQSLEKGRVKLDMPIRFYLPELREAWADSVNIHHLLTHTHGITALDKPLAFKPGSQFQYSQLGFDLLARILEHSNGRSFASLSDELFKFCGMKHSSHPDIHQYTRLVKAYSANTKGVLEPDTNGFRNYVAAGTFISSAYDQYLWNSFLHNGKLLKEDTYQTMFSRQPNATRAHPLFGPTSYAYGTTIDTSKGLLQVGQTGLTPGFVSMNFYFPETRTSLIILENIEYNTEDLKNTFFYHTRILDILRQELLSINNR